MNRLCSLLITFMLCSMVWGRSLEPDFDNNAGLYLDIDDPLVITDYHCAYDGALNLSLSGTPDQIHLMDEQQVVDSFVFPGIEG